MALHHSLEELQSLLDAVERGERPVRTVDDSLALHVVQAPRAELVRFARRAYARGSAATLRLIHAEFRRRGFFRLESVGAAA